MGNNTLFTPALCQVWLKSLEYQYFCCGYGEVANVKSLQTERQRLIINFT